VARTVATVFAVLLALPFLFGSLRAADSGTRFAFGLVIGIGLFVLQRGLESGAVVFNGNPVLFAWFPTLLMAAVAIGLIARTR
jgi:lipopolysaccharide export LptBFGC system permease protein LptF